ncbi:hypothetical protein ORI89_12830 [Sphingobacterium sp. UT-1RO-CII-1]|nr:hypothetical protein [Sphingobacterium sp. UT-1RO-CII-1]MCY4780539.1 hypothetical protein [Sphingobacterium sp. UT-1RO-CII-1]
MANDRKYLIFEDIKNEPSLRGIFDTCVDDILEDKARLAKTRN